MALELQDGWSVEYVRDSDHVETIEGDRMLIIEYIAD